MKAETGAWRSDTKNRRAAIVLVATFAVVGCAFGAASNADLEGLTAWEIYAAGRDVYKSVREPLVSCLSGSSGSGCDLNVEKVRDAYKFMSAFVALADFVSRHPEVANVPGFASHGITKPVYVNAAAEVVDTCEKFLTSDILTASSSSQILCMACVEDGTQTDSIVLFDPVSGPVKLGLTWTSPGSIPSLTVTGVTPTGQQIPQTGSGTIDLDWITALEPGLIANLAVGDIVFQLPSSDVVVLRDLPEPPSADELARAALWQELEGGAALARLTNWPSRRLPAGQVGPEASDYLMRSSSRVWVEPAQPIPFPSDIAEFLLEVEFAIAAGAPGTLSLLIQNPEDMGGFEVQFTRWHDDRVSYRIFTYAPAPAPLPRYATLVCNRYVPQPGLAPAFGGGRTVRLALEFGPQGFTVSLDDVLLESVAYPVQIGRPTMHASFSGPGETIIKRVAVTTD